MRANEGRDPKQGVRQCGSRQEITGDWEGFVRKGEGARDMMRSTYFEGGAIREGKGDEGQRLGGEKRREQREVGQLHQNAGAARVSNEGRRRDDGRQD